MNPQTPASTQQNGAQPAGEGITRREFGVRSLSALLVPSVASKPLIFGNVGNISQLFEAKLAAIVEAVTCRHGDVEIGTASRMLKSVLFENLTGEELEFTVAVALDRVTAIYSPLPLPNAGELPALRSAVEGFESVQQVTVSDLVANPDVAEIMSAKSFPVEVARGWREYSIMTPEEKQDAIRALLRQEKINVQIYLEEANRLRHFSDAIRKAHSTTDASRLLHELWNGGAESVANDPRRLARVTYRECLTELRLASAFPDRSPEDFSEVIEQFRAAEGKLKEMGISPPDELSAQATRALSETEPRAKMRKSETDSPHKLPKLFPLNKLINVLSVQGRKTHFDCLVEKGGDAPTIQSAEFIVARTDGAIEMRSMVRDMRLMELNILAQSALSAAQIECPARVRICYGEDGFKLSI